MHRREELKKLLLTKFQGKYAGQQIPSQLIEDQVNRFLDTTALTAENLKLLDAAILQAANVKPSSAAHSSKSRDKPSEVVKESKKSVPKVPTPAKEGKKVAKKVATQPSPSAAAPAEDADDRLSVMSGATEFGTGKQQQRQFLDTKTKMVKAEEVGERPKTEEDEWAAIVNFNNTLYQEELRQEQEKKTAQKQLMKAELEKQVRAKQEQKARVKAEDNAFMEYQKQNLQREAERERKKEEERKALVQQEKQSREKQRRDDVVRKRLEEREDKRQEREMLERMKLELALEKQNDRDRKELEKTTMKQMMEESMKLKEEQRAVVKREREEDVKMQDAQKKMLDLQEADRVADLLRKDERNKQLLEAALKATGGKGIPGGSSELDDRLKEQLNMLSAKKQAEEEHKAKLRKQKELEIKTALDAQVVERKERKHLAQEQNQQQASMWKQDLEVHYAQEQANQQKVKQVNKAHQDYLLKQMEQGKKSKATVMSEREYQMNKKLLEEVQKATKVPDPSAPPPAADS